MEISRYEIILPLCDKNRETIKGKGLLVNGLYGAFDVVSRETAEALKKGDLEAVPGEERERLLRRGHLTEDREREKEDLKMLARVERQISRSGAGLVLLPTYDCNFRCPYCFEKHRLSSGDEWLKKTMSREMVDAIFQGAGKLIQRGVRIENVTLYGGEPLLKKNIGLIRYITEKAAGISKNLSVITNGYELDSYIELLKEFSFKHIQITLDGEREVNDRRRVHKDGIGSYDRILRNVELAVQNGLPVALRINTGPENIDTAASLKKVFEEKGLIGSEHFSYYFKATFGEYYPGKDYGINDVQIFEMLLDRGYSFEEAVKLENAYGGIGGELAELFKKEEYMRPVASYCGAESGMYVIDPEGTIFSCWDFVAMKDMAVGKVDVETGKYLFGLPLAQWRTRTVQLMPKCSECPYCFACRGGCAGKAYFEKGDYMTELCGESKKIFDDIASVAAGVRYEETKETELTKSLKEAVSALDEGQRSILITSKSQREIYETAKPFLQKAGSED